MRIPGFTATASLSQTHRGGAARTRKAVPAEPAIVPAQVDWERVSRILSSRGAVRRLWEDRPACPLGERAVWVSRGPTEACCKTEVRVWDSDQGKYTYVEVPRCGWQWCGWNPGFTGWECQSTFRVVT